MRYRHKNALQYAYYYDIIMYIERRVLYADHYTDYRSSEYYKDIRALPWEERAGIYHKNGYSDLVIMSMEAYEALTAAPQAVQPEKMCYLTEQSPIWAGMLADVLQQNGIPFFKESSLGAGLAIKTGGLSESIRFFVPVSRIDGARELVEELFSKEKE